MAKPNARAMSWSLHPANRTGTALIFALSAALTGAGFLIEPVPFAVAYIPFGMVLIFTPRCCGHHWQAIALMAGHFIWPVLISGWGLIHLGLNPFLVIAGGLTVTLTLSSGIAWLGIGLSAILLSAVPFFPASPLLVTGALLPVTGLWGLAALPLCLIVIETRARIALRAGLLLGLIALPLLMEMVLGLPSHPVPNTTYEELGISRAVALTERGHWQQIINHADPGDHLILGENMFDHDDRAALSWWCRNITTRQISAMIGVRGPSGAGEIWQFDATTCPRAIPVYRARIGIPHITGGWVPQTVHFARGSEQARPQPETTWLICFEAFSLWRWIGVALARPDQVVVLANDRWTAPFSTARLRRKVTHQFARLLGVNIAHADSGKTVLIRKSPRPEGVSY